MCACSHPLHHPCTEKVFFEPAVSASFTYDTLGRLRTSSDPNGTLTYTYDAAGRRTALTNSSGYAMRTVYDDAGRPATVYEGTGTAERPVATYAYSTTSGRLERVDRFDSTTTYTYDALGRITRLWTTTSGNAAVLDLTYHYNRAGERIRVDDSQRGTLTYAYDGLGRLTAETIAGVTTRWTSDRVGNRLTEAVGSAPPHTVRSYNGANQVVGWTYDVAGNLIAEGSQSDPNVNHYTYDIYNRLQKVDTPTTDRAYHYLDTMLLAEAESIGGTADTTSVQDWGSGLSRIIQQTSNGTTSGFVYGPAGDRLLTTSAAGDTYDHPVGSRRRPRYRAGNAWEPFGSHTHRHHHAHALRLHRRTPAARHGPRLPPTDTVLFVKRFFATVSMDGSRVYRHDAGHATSRQPTGLPVENERWISLGAYLGSYAASWFIPADTGTARCGSYIWSLVKTAHAMCKSFRAAAYRATFTQGVPAYVSS